MGSFYSDPFKRTKNRKHCNLYINGHRTNEFSQAHAGNVLRSDYIFNSLLRVSTSVSFRRDVVDDILNIYFQFYAPWIVLPHAFFRQTSQKRGNF